MGAGASAAADIEEYEAKFKNTRRLSEIDKKKINQFKLGKNECLSKKLEVLKIDDSLSKEVRAFVEYKLQKIAREVALEAINQAALLIANETGKAHRESYGQKCEEIIRAAKGVNKK